MSAFTDDDLKRFKSICLGTRAGSEASIGDIADLIARLEAAEAVFMAIETSDELPVDLLQAWRKAKGEAK
jgi:hypothetical protein